MFDSKYVLRAPAADPAGGQDHSLIRVDDPEREADFLWRCQSCSYEVAVHDGVPMVRVVGNFMVFHALPEGTLWDGLVVSP